MSKKRNIDRQLKNLLMTFAVPLTVFFIMELIVYSLMGTHLINTTLDIRNLIRDMGMSSIIAYALSLNLSSGRFDLSLGAQRLVGTIIGGNLALKLGFNGIELLILAMLFGLLFGFIVGYIFITFRVPPVVLGLGMALIYESIAFASSNGQGLQLFAKPKVDILVDPTFTLVVLAIVTLGVYILFSFTKFRYEMQAVRGSQKIARDSGINIFKHVAMCYTLAGGLVAISGVFDAAFTGSLIPTLGMSSNTTVLGMTFPMFVGIYLARRSNMAIGILLGTLTLKFFSLGLTALKLPSSLTSTIVMIAFIAFLVFLANADVFKVRKAQKERIKEAFELRKKVLLG